METRTIRYQDLMQLGSIVDSKISIWTARTALNEADYGLQPDANLHAALNVGIARLVPKKALKQYKEIAAEVVALINRYSVDFDLVRGARFVTNENLPVLVEKLEEQIALAKVARDLFCDTYQQLIDEQEPVLRAALLVATKGDQVVADRAFRRIKAQYPSVEEIRGKFDIRYKVFKLAGPDADLVAGAAQQEAEEARDLVRSMVTQLREEFRERMEIIREVVSRGGTLRSDTIASAREVLDKIRSMNIFNDLTLNSMVNTLGAVLDRAEASKGKVENGGMLGALDGMSREITASQELAVANAIDALTGMGRRKLEVI